IRVSEIFLRLTAFCKYTSSATTTPTSIDYRQCIGRGISTASISGCISRRIRARFARARNEMNTPASKMSQSLPNTGRYTKGGESCAPYGIHSRTLLRVHGIASRPRALEPVDFSRYTLFKQALRLAPDHLVVQTDINEKFADVLSVQHFAIPRKEFSVWLNFLCMRGGRRFPLPKNAILPPWRYDLTRGPF
ncbi:hypothetical protein HII31_03576, partial [Pseudocercospora fuligena]